MPKNKYRYLSFKCIGCETFVNARRRKLNNKYCSLSCYRKSERPGRKNGRHVNCCNCGKEIYKQECHLATPNNFCGKDCFNVWFGRNKVKRTCIICGKDFLLSPSTAKSRLGIYCSIPCRNKSPEWKKASAKANASQCRKKGLNRLEKCGEEILKEIGVNYESQRLLFDKFLVDCFLPEHNVIIQWDGEYWHGHVSKLKNGIPDHRQDRRMKLDKSQDAYFQTVGMTVIRFWESDVFKRKGEVIEAIKRTIHEAS